MVSLWTIAKADPQYISNWNIISIIIPLFLATIATIFLNEKDPGKLFFQSLTVPALILTIGNANVERNNFGPPVIKNPDEIKEISTSELINKIYENFSQIFLINEAYAQSKTPENKKIPTLKSGGGVTNICLNNWSVYENSLEGKNIFSPKFSSFESVLSKSKQKDGTARFFNGKNNWRNFTIAFGKTSSYKTAKTYGQKLNAILGEGKVQVWHAGVDENKKYFLVAGSLEPLQSATYTAFNITSKLYSCASYANQNEKLKQAIKKFTEASAIIDVLAVTKKLKK